MNPAVHLRDYLGTGALVAVLGESLPALGHFPDDVRHAVWGAIGAALAYAVGKIIRALGDRAERAILGKPARARAKATASTDEGTTATSR